MLKNRAPYQWQSDETFLNEMALAHAVSDWSKFEIEKKKNVFNVYS